MDTAASVQHVNSVVKELLCGCAAGGANVVSGFGFDTVKVRLQTNPGGPAQQVVLARVYSTLGIEFTMSCCIPTAGIYKGMTDCFLQIVRKQGVRGLFHGLTPPLIGGAAETGVNYAVYSQLLASFKRMDAASRPSPQAAVAVSAAGAGVCLSVILAPTELIKCRMQAGGSRYRSPVHCVQQLLHTEGWKGLTRGFGATLAREVPGNTIFFIVYEAVLCAHGSLMGGRGLHQHGLPSAKLTPRTAGEIMMDAGSAILCGGLSGTVMWASVLPLDVAKTRQQTAAPGSRWDVGVGSLLKMMWQEGGMRSLYAGLGPTLLRAFPANACQWLAWELTMHNLSQGS